MSSSFFYTNGTRNNEVEFCKLKFQHELFFSSQHELKFCGAGDCTPVLSAANINIKFTGSLKMSGLKIAMSESLAS